MDNMAGCFFLLCLQPYTQRAGQLVDSAVRKHHGCILGSIADTVNNDLLEICLFDVGNHLLVIENLCFEGFHYVVAGVVEDAVQALGSPCILRFIKYVQQAGLVLQFCHERTGNLVQRIVEALGRGCFQFFSDCLDNPVAQLFQGFFAIIQALVCNQARQDTEAFLFDPVDGFILENIDIPGIVEKIILQFRNKRFSKRVFQFFQLFLGECAKFKGFIHSLLQGLNQLRREIIQVLGDFGQVRLESVALEQVCQSGGLEQLDHNVLDQRGQHFAHCLLGNVLVQSDFPGQVINVGGDHFFQLPGKVILILDFGFNGFRRCRGRRFLNLCLRGHGKYGSFNIPVAHLCDVVQVYNIDIHAYTQAEVGVGGARVGPGLCDGSVQRCDGDNGTHHIDPVQHFGTGFTVLDIDHDGAGNTDRSLTGLRFLAVICLLIDRAAGYGAGLVLPGQVPRRAHQAVRLAVGTLLGIRIAAGVAGIGNLNQVRARIGGYDHIPCVYALVHLGNGTVRDHGNRDRRADADADACD